MKHESEKYVETHFYTYDLSVPNLIFGTLNTLEVITCLIDSMTPGIGTYKKINAVLFSKLHINQYLKRYN